MIQLPSIQNLDQKSIGNEARESQRGETSFKVIKEKKDIDIELPDHDEKSRHQNKKMIKE